MRILVTGGAGFIGSHVCVELLGAGHDVVIVDNLSNSKPETVDKIGQIAGRRARFHNDDLRDPGAVRAIFAEEPVDAVIHCAGYKAVGESVLKPLEYYGNNLDGTLVLCEAMCEAGCKRIVFSSSATVYGMDNPVPFREEMPTAATNPYGHTKRMIEQILADLAQSDPEWSVMNLRYFNPVGAHPSGLIGEDPSGTPNNLVPYVSQVAAGVRPEVLVYGDDYPTPDGTGVRDYIHVMDLARGHLAAVEHVREHAGVETVNLGTGQGTSVLEMVRAYSEACGTDLPYRVVDRRPGDIAICYADTQKARTLLGWSAREDLARMCADSWNYARSRYGSRSEASEAPDAACPRGT